MKHLLVLLSTATFIHAQGPLTPPGAPAPTMKTLAQIEPRIDVLTLASAPPYVINQPGSYYLSANITVPSGQDGIEILAANVTLDLNGFTIFPTSGSFSGSAIHAAQPAVIRNGFIKSWGSATEGNYAANGFWTGISMFSDGTVENLIVEGCTYGIFTDGTVTNCNVDQSRIGITADTVFKCVSKRCADVGIFVTTRCSQSEGSGYLSGIDSTGAEIDECQGSAVMKFGINGNNVSRSKGVGSEAGIVAGGNVSDSTGICRRDTYTEFRLYGIKAAGNVSNSTASCTGDSGNPLDWFGIHCDNATNCSATSNGVGIRAFANVTNCYGKASFTGIGIWADGTATSCRGDHAYASATALRAAIAVSCTRAQGIIDSPSKHLGTP